MLFAGAWARLKTWLLCTTLGRGGTSERGGTGPSKWGVVGKKPGDVAALLAVSGVNRLLATH